jgi:hypothetical protein
MPELAGFQRDFVTRLDQPMPAAAPMRVYLNTVMLGAVQALEANFPVCQMILGARAFEAAALAFARRHPPQVPVLAHYGSEFPDWLATQPFHNELPYLADVARCEVLHTEALHAADAAALQPETLESLPPDRLLTFKLRLHPAARFSWLKTPAMAIWIAHQSELTGELAPDWKAGGAMFTRPGVRVEATEVDSLSHRLLAGIRLGESLGGAAQAASLLYPGAAIGEAFGALVARGAFLAALN